MVTSTKTTVCMSHRLYPLCLLPRSDKSVLTAVLGNPLFRRDWSFPTASRCVVTVLRRRLLRVSICGSAASTPDPKPVSASQPQLYAEFNLQPRIWRSPHPALSVDRVEPRPTLPEEQEVALFQQDKVTQIIHHCFFPAHQVFSFGKKINMCFFFFCLESWQDFKWNSSWKAGKKKTGWQKGGIKAPPLHPATFPVKAI